MAVGVDNNLQLVAEEFTFPTSIAFDDKDRTYVAESGLPFGGAEPGGRIWQLSADGKRSLIAKGLRQPVNGVVFYEGGLYVSEGGHPYDERGRRSGRISRFELDGHQTVILDNLPGPGNYHTNMAVFGPDGKLYFSQGAMTNSGIVGLDAYEVGWLRRLPHAHDIPGHDLVLTGVNIETTNPLSDQPDARAVTGAFVPFGTPTEPGQRVPAGLPCTAAVMRCNADGSALELVAWGVRNAFGLCFLPDGRLLATDQGADDRGSRPVGNAPDLLIEVKQGAWYGWPDFIGDEPVTYPTYAPERGQPPSFVVANHDEMPPLAKPLLRFPPHVAAVKFDALPPDAPAWSGQLLVALFGEEVPMTAPRWPRVGRSIARVDPSDWSLHEGIRGPFARPIDVRFNRADESLYVLDFGHFEFRKDGLDAKPRSGRLWKMRLRKHLGA